MSYRLLLDIITIPKDTTMLTTTTTTFENI